MRRQSDPELEAAGEAGLACAAAVPHAVAGPHPLDTTRCQQTASTVRVLIADAALGQVGQRRDTGMRMQSETSKLSPAVVEEVDEDEWLEQFAQLAWTRQPSDRAMCLAASAVDNRSQSSNILNGDVHDPAPCCSEVRWR